ncbi:NUDIX hydrolase [Mycobacterium sp. 141]|uniref:NUDIX hydrolase n=1 Tax=Mycobacterium sp. 141 TaxID=1120797 RepID=UPI0003A53BA8|nr:NUDIX hydrolase [Mycobacterium sp. 141]
MSTPEADSPVDLRCAVVVVRDDTVLLIERPDRGDWVLPGGRPRGHENMGSCARREVREETGLDVQPNRCGLVLEVNDPIRRRRIVELVFLAELFNRTTPLVGEPGRHPDWVSLAEVKQLRLSPPIGGFLPDLAYRRGEIGRYVGNMWRPDGGSS